MSSEGRLLLTNLLNDLETLAPLLADRVAAGDPLDAFLLAAGMQQVAEDHVHPDPLFLDRAAARLRRRLPAPWGRPAGAAAAAAASVLWEGTVRTRDHAASAAWLAELDTMVQRLAADVVQGAPAGSADVEALVSAVPSLPASLRESVLRLPSCFRSFDQAPEDVGELAAALVGRWPDPDSPVLVVGVRTSGSYLAPLTAAWLRRLGRTDVQVATLRPGQRWRREEARRLRAAAGRGALAVLVDDPPRSWGSVVRAARELVRLGFDRRRTALLLATFPDAARRPAALAEHPAVLLPYAAWSIHRRLEPERVRESLAAWLDVAAVRPLPDPPAPVGRGHAEAVYEVVRGEAGRVRRQLVRARGVGLGCFGAHALAVAARLPGRTAHVHGLDRGVLFEAWSPPADRLGEPLDAGQAAAVASYVAERAAALALDRDPGRRLQYRGAAWQWAGHALGGVFGRASELGRPLAAAVVRRLLTVDAPAVIDNRARLDSFSPTAGGLVKHDFDAGVFTSDDFCCFDPVSDVALAAVSAADAGTADQLRRAYEAATGRPIDPERWLLYQLAHVLQEHEKLPPDARQTDQRPARLLQGYFGEVLVGGLEGGGPGPLCAIDLDGVLETTPLGFPATTWLGALALRALARHGYRAVLATGRSLDEVRDRCLVYGLAGGVAEYGSVLFVHGRAQALLTPAECWALERLRSTAAAAGGVHLDPAFRHSVRAFRLDAAGRRRGLPPGLAAGLLSASGTSGRLRAVPGHYQTDFAAAGATKERALRVLAGELGAGGERPIALAVGDTASDLGMLEMAGLGIAPGNADRAVKGSARVTVVRQRAQAGLSEAVGRLLGHRPGRCPVCAPPALPERSRLLLDLLSVPEPSRRRQVARGLRLLRSATTAGTGRPGESRGL
jgi:hypothetical protein